MKTFTEIIDKYLHNQLSETDKKKFEAELQKNEALRKELEVQKEIMRGIEQLGIQTEINSSIKKARFNKLLKKIAVATLAFAIAATGAYLISKSMKDSHENNVHYELNEKGEANWSEADRALESQLFSINPNRDTIIETNNGIIFQIKANAFLNKFGEVPQTAIDLEVKEAMTAADIIKAGLSTTSNGQLLETGGMFYINARHRDEVLDIDQSKAIKVNVPTDADKNMSLFEGERKADGSINWIKPKAMKKQLTTVPITSLNFYPPHFLDSLAAMGFDIKNKGLTDSIYYSFTRSYRCEDAAASDTTRFYDEGLILFDAQGEPFLAGKSAKKDSLRRGRSLAGTSSHSEKPDGEKLFNQNCIVCHSAHTDKMGTGPSLLGMSARTPGRDWLVHFILNSSQMIASGNEYANIVYNKNGKASMPSYDHVLHEEEVLAIIDYINQVNPIKITHESNRCIAEINPSRIKAIWNPEFNGTILATRQFEERLQVIFGTCNPDVFNVYAKNLTSNLYELDSVAATLTNGESRQKFIEFYKRHDGAVDISDEQNASLQKYLAEKKAIYDKAIGDAMDKLYSEENKLANEAEKTKYEYNNQLNEKQAKLLNEEIEANMDEAYRQLGKQRVKNQVVVNPRSYQVASISTPGWWNVDRYVIESTITRTTSDYTDSTTGKKALIEYLPATIKVNGAEAYDKVMCYLLTDKLNSFQLMKGSAGLFTEKLNQSFANSVIVVAYKNGKTFYKDIKYIKPEAYTVDLEAIDAEALVRRLNMRYNFTGTADVLKDIDFSIYEHKEKIRTDKIAARERIRERVYMLVYPCAEYYMQQLPAGPVFENN